MDLTQLAQFAPVVSSLAATISAIVAYNAARLNKAAQDDARAARELSTTADLYRYQVREPLQAYVRAFSDETLALLSTKLPLVTGNAEPDMLASSARVQARTLVSDLKSSWHRASHIMMAGAEAWNPRMFDELELAREEVADRITGLVARRMSGSDDTPVDPATSYEVMVHQHTVKILQIAVAHEPALQNAARGPTRGKYSVAVSGAAAVQSGNSAQRKLNP